uniref:Uncharacterized protein n=1 Tax=Dicentrarchus labrax TaxID=13489 RepID=A0A8C4H604_DICLA
MPIGAPRPGGIPIGGPMGGRMPGGGPIIPAGGGAPRPIGGGAPRPGGYCVGAPAMLAPAAAAATVPLPSVAIVTCCEGMGAPAGTPRPAARPTPGPPATPASGTRSPIGCWVPLTSLGGGPSTVIETRFSPLSRTRPRTLFSSRSGCFEFFGLKDTNTLPRMIRFMCLSKALKVPMKIRPSCRMHLILKSMCCSILLLLPTVCGPIRDSRHCDITNTGVHSTTLYLKPYTHTHTHTHTVEVGDIYRLR